MTDTSSPALELYIMPTCPYCRKVQLYITQHGIELPLRDITTDTDARQTLADVGGKVQVPCLFIDGTALYESDDIIAYLADRFADGAALEISPEDQARLDDGAACPIIRP